MKIIIFGATGKTGQHVWCKALEQRHEVTVFVRSPAKIETVDEKLCVVQGDIFDADSVSRAIANHDAVIVCIGSISLSDKTTLSTGTKNVIDGMVQNNIDRVIVVSTAGVGESWSQIPWLSRILFKTMLRNVFSDHQHQEKLLQESNLNWTIVRAAVLKDGAATGDYISSNTEKVGSINRADLADFLVKQVVDTNYIRQSISVTS